MGILHIGADGNLETGNDRNQYLNVLKVWDEKLKLLLALGERYKEEGEKMKNEFWINQGNSEFYDLVEKFEESKEKFIEGLEPEEKRVINSLNEIEKEKYLKEYLYERILYSGDLSKNGETGILENSDVKNEWGVSDEDLKLLISIGEKYEKEGGEMYQDFRESGSVDVLNKKLKVLLVKFEESKEKFIEGLEPEEKRVINSLNEKEREQFFKRYLNERILYGGDVEQK